MHPLLTFALKTSIVAVAVIISLVIVTDRLIDGIDSFVDARVRQIEESGLGKAPNGKFGGRVFWERLEQALDKAANPKNDLSPERQQKLLRDVRVLVDRARPFALEAEKVFTPQPATTQGQDK